MEYLLKEDIILINRKTIERHGGNFVPPFNFLHEEPLDYLIEAVQAKMFGEEIYPTVSDKAGLYMFNTISNHIFQDGNKRSGLGSALLFLRMNSYSLSKKLEKIHYDNKSIPAKGESNTEILIEFTLEVAAGKVSLEETQQWFKKNIKKR